MKTLELLRTLRSQVDHALDPLQFAYRELSGVEDAVLFMLHWAYTHLDYPESYVRVMLLDFSSAFNTIRPRILGDKLKEIGVDISLITWILDYLTEQPQFVKLDNCLSEMVLSSTGAPHGTVSHHSCSCCTRLISSINLGSVMYRNI